ncbi:cytochrome d ubiquinol oxidase subunit II [Glacieibacterium frigidum]|uniref:Cytochrome d ubiquinol oxidase subunit II n=1 Tax=Glacieibacterium frigidum TaxID=2593303 RepID=A0A552UEQ2_9SPHN|nr:cytochrome d ubiquinol oxidase subunit II [Glacieibacterium frigidum]TRW16649.1 cytochrome d ubiquinol oxidase subunit II [Glacieibacterium frigidum]
MGLGFDFDLTVIWAGILAFAVFAYVVMDGFDLGIGILFPLLDPGQQRDATMNSVAPVWDGNETWLILGGGGLMAAFPLAYAIILPAVYVPLIAMLLGLVFRGVAFEFRWRTTRQPIWDFAFFAGSVVAAFTQGVVLGAVLQGISVEGRSYSGLWWEWLSPFSLLCGASVVIGYGLLGACWLIYRTENELQDRAYRLAWLFGIGTSVAVVAVSLATPFLEAEYYKRWFSAPGIYVLSPIPLLAGAAALGFFRALSKRAELAPFLLALALFLLSFIGLGVSMFPYLVPGEITIWQAAAPAKSQMFMLVGTAVMVPVIIAYSAYAYWVFRGKVGHEGYH